MQDDSNPSPWEIAETRASAYAPLPKQYAFIAGLTGAFVTVFSVLLFLAFAGLDSEDFKMAFAWTAFVGFLAPFLYFKLQERKHYKAVSRELEALKREQ